MKSNAKSAGEAFQCKMPHQHGIHQESLKLSTGYKQARIQDFEMGGEFS